MQWRRFVATHAQLDDFPRVVAIAASHWRAGLDTRSSAWVKARLAAAARDGSAGDTAAARMFTRVMLEELARDLGAAPPDVAGQVAGALEQAAACMARASAGGFGLAVLTDAAYPGWLRHIFDPPVALWVAGRVEVLGGPSVAVVGSRDATPAGLLVARRLGRGLAESGLCVVSGLARGVDGAAHEGALDAGGRTVAVLGCGVDVVYPRQHGGLAEAVARAGAVVSELPPGSPPLPRHFPLRNRVISGLSRAVVVVEASERSGSLITARMALEQGRDVLAVPGGIASGRHRGCHALIKDGARLVETVEDVLDEIGWRRLETAPAAGSSNPLITSHLDEIMAAGEPYGLDDLAATTGRPGPEILAELGRLELAGRIVRIGAGSFIRLDASAMDRE
jgi:DNA processing protein